MKYKCIANCYVEDTIIMKPGDIIVLNDNNIFNISSGIDYKNIPNIDKIKSCLETITDEINIPEEKSILKNNCTKFEEITSKMNDIYIRKNHDYGNSFEQSLNEEGLAAARIRIGDKWNRFKTLSKNKDIKVKDESIKDTLLDMANYCIMTAMWLK